MLTQQAKVNGPNSMKHILLASALMIAGCGAVFSQGSSTFSSATPAGLAAGSPLGSYTLSDMEQYDPFSGRMNVIIPIYHVGGRGNVGFDLLYAVPQTWRIDNELTPAVSPANGQFSYQSVFQPPQPWTPSGQILGPGTVWIREGASYQVCAAGYPYEAYSTLTTITFTAPDGTETELVDDSTDGQPAQWTSPCQNATPSSSWKRGVFFHSASGAAQIEFVSDTYLWDSQEAYQGQASGYLYFPNGTTYRVDNSLVSWMEDRNGNEITFSYNSNNALTSISDPLGRTISINYQDPSCVQCTTITYPGYQGASRVVRLYFEPVSNVLRSGYPLDTYTQLFPNDTADAGKGQFNPNVLYQVEYPDGRLYTFEYNSYAEIAAINLPTGGAVQYDYGDGNNGTTSGYQSNSSGVGIIYRRLQERREYLSGSTPSSRTHNTVSYPNSTTVETQITYDGSGNVMGQVVHTMNGSPADGLSMVGVACNPWNEGLETRTDYGTPSPLKTVTNQYVPQSGCMNNPQLQSSNTTLDDTNQVSQTSYQYDKYNNVTDVKRYGWGAGAPGALINEIQTTYVWSSNSTYAQEDDLPYAAYLVAFPASQTVLDGSGNLAAKTQWWYDQTTPQANPGMGGHDDTNFGPNNLHRGNPSMEQHWWSTISGYLTIQRTFDVAGNVLTQQDPDGNTTTFSYADPQNTYAHATQATNALQQSVSAAYDYNTSKITSSTGLNGEQTSYAYNDPLDRVTTIQLPNGGKRYYSYPNYTTAIVQQDQNTAGDSALKSQILYDGFGRLSESDIYELSSQYIATTQQYDAMGRIASATNPSRSGDGLNYPTTYNYDSLGRIKQVAASDNVTSTLSYSGNTTTVTDPAGHTKTYTRDSLGELLSVTETVQSGTVLNTYYSYDALGDLVCVSQTACPGAPTRSFTYDTLRNLVKAVNPESGTVTYGYNGDGHPTYRTDNRNISTGYWYDKLNRLTSVTYGSDGQNVTYTYDTGGANSIGQLVSVANGSTTNYTAFDSMGHVLSSNQVTIGTTYPFTYTYNLAGSLTSETYPSGRVVTTSYDGANRPSQVTGSLQGSNTNYLTQAWYWPHGAVGYYTFANNVVPAFAYNRHFQPTKIYAAINDSPNSFLFMECYNWGAPNADGYYGTCPTWSGTNDNGNLYGSVTYTGGPGAQSSLTAYTDTFTYDGLNRLLTASDSGGWSRNYAYDQFGNMWVTGSTGPGLNSATPTSNVYNSKNQMSTATYDASGNQLTMGPYTVGYDAENHQVSESNTIGNPQADYNYDGSGRRVVRMVGAQTTVYVYDAFGALAAAYSNGAMGTAPCHTCYLTYDHLGTTRLITDPKANVIARHDFLPFGEEIPGGIAGRSASQFGPGLDNINQKFTGQERDSESGLDYFHARYFGGALGRFLSSDPGNAGASLTSPQSWNAYAYAQNNPLNATDPSGRDTILPIPTFTVTAVCCSITSSLDYSLAPDLIVLSHPPFRPASPPQSKPAPPKPPETEKPKPPDDDVVIDLDIFHTQPKLWSNTAGAGNTLAAATAVVTVAPFVLGGAVTTEAPSLLAGETPLIGDLADTAGYVGQEGYNVLFVNEAEYGEEAQAIWITDAINSGQSFQLATPLPGEANSVFAAEAASLQGQGYTLIGNFLVPPAP
jgi:RHS repeat-associated protein